MYLFSTADGGKAAGANQSRRIFDESIVVQNPDQLSFNISRPIERIHQQAARTWVQR